MGVNGGGETEPPIQKSRLRHVPKRKNGANILELWCARFLALEAVVGPQNTTTKVHDDSKAGVTVYRRAFNKFCPYVLGSTTWWSECCHELTNRLSAPRKKTQLQVGLGGKHDSFIYRRYICAETLATLE